MDNSLKELESQLESLLPRGLSDEGEASCSALIDRLAAGEVDDLAPYQSGLTWKASAAAAVVALGIGLGSGWWLGKGVSIPQDLVEKDFSKIKFWHDFDDFNTLPLPANKEEYLSYKEKVIEFLHGRNQRILNSTVLK